jgi:CBS domain containing-hemolysin-like protein
VEDNVDYLLIIGCLILSAFFSSAETAFFSLSKFQLKKLETSNKSSNKRILKLLKYPRQLLITILLGNTIVNIAAASIAAGIALNFESDVMNKELFLVIEVVLMTIILLIVGEITPKLCAFANAEKIASFSSAIIQSLKFILFPIIFILERISMLFTKNSVLENEPHELTKEDFENLINSDSQSSSLEEKEKEIIRSIFKFPSISVKDIMIPRVDIVAVDIAKGIVNAKKKILRSGHSRIPVYKNSIDDVIGFIYAKDLILNETKKTIASLLRRPMFVTENMKIQTLLNQFKSRKVHIAVVVDEYGGTAGLISMEDILEELVGEIMDEYDNEKPEMVKISENEFILSGMMNTRDLNEEFHICLDEEEHENLAAFLYDEFNHVPKKNEKLEYNNRFTFTIKSIKGQRIDYVKLVIAPEEEGLE